MSETRLGIYMPSYNIMQNQLEAVFDGVMQQQYF